MRYSKTITPPATYSMARPSRSSSPPESTYVNALVTRSATAMGSIFGATFSEVSAAIAGSSWPALHAISGSGPKNWQPLNQTGASEIRSRMHKPKKGAPAWARAQAQDFVVIGRRGKKPDAFPSRCLFTARTTTKDSPCRAVRGQAWQTPVIANRTSCLHTKAVVIEFGSNWPLNAGIQRPPNGQNRVLSTTSKPAA